MQVMLTTIHNTQEIVDFAVLLWRSKYTILYFYPKDNTSGCTIEAKEFTDLIDRFADLDTQIIGVSKDTHRSHCNFIEKHWLKITLVSDPELSLHKKFDVLWEKSMYGRKYIGTLRNTYLLDPAGSVLHMRPTVSARGHAQNVLDYIQSL